MEEEEELWGWGLQSENVWNGLGECIEAYIQECLLGEVSKGDILEVAAFKRINLPEDPPNCVNWCLENLMENLDSEYGNPDGCSELDLQMERDVWLAVKKHYLVWRCNPTGHTETIDLYKWAQEFGSEYLPDAS